MSESITPCLWFNNQAKEAAAFYCTHFTQAKIAAQSPIVTEIDVAGQHITLLDGGPKHQPNASISLFYMCATEEEINRLWMAFTQEKSVVLMPLAKYDWSECYGWLNDPYGVSWQFCLGQIEEVGQRITPSLLFTGAQYGRAEEAIRHYSAIFKNAVQDGILRYGNEETPEQEGTVKHAQIALNGQKFMFMDSAQPNEFSFSEGVSFIIYCDTQEEIDHYWNKLTEGGEESWCGWLKDKFGISWQVVPTLLKKLMSDPDKAEKTTQAFLQMRKFDIEKLVQASHS